MGWLHYLSDIWFGMAPKTLTKKKDMFKRNWTTFSNMCAEHLRYETST